MVVTGIIADNASSALWAFCSCVNPITAFATTTTAMTEASTTSPSAAAATPAATRTYTNGLCSCSSRRTTAPRWCRAGRLLGPSSSRRRPASWWSRPSSVWVPSSWATSCTGNAWWGSATGQPSGTRDGLRRWSAASSGSSRCTRFMHPSWGRSAGHGSRTVARRGATGPVWMGGKTKVPRRRAQARETRGTRCPDRGSRTRAGQSAERRDPGELTLALADPLMPDFPEPEHHPAGPHCVDSCLARCLIVAVTASR